LAWAVPPSACTAWRTGRRKSLYGGRSEGSMQGTLNQGPRRQRRAVPGERDRMPDPERIRERRTKQICVRRGTSRTGWANRG
jgi:hypothetical protein